MNTTSDTGLPQRGPCDGMLKIMRYNWPQYAIGAVAVLVGATLAVAAPLPIQLKSVLWIGSSCAAFWLIASLAVSYYVYDLSPLYHWSWLADFLPQRPHQWMNIHVGLDDSTPALRRLFPDATGRVLDVFDDREMGEPSIRRARRDAASGQGEPAEWADFAALPLADGSCDTVFLLFCAHELRSPQSRRRFFGELHRTLVPGGTVVLVEHLRDAWNFAAFGPGFMHFFARRTWRELARDSGFTINREIPVTPFVVAFLLRREA